MQSNFSVEKSNKGENGRISAVAWKEAQSDKVFSSATKFFRAIAFVYCL
jgi:hypothetical protein